MSRVCMARAYACPFEAVARVPRFCGAGFRWAGGVSGPGLAIMRQWDHSAAFLFMSALRANTIDSVAAMAVATVIAKPINVLRSHLAFSLAICW